MSSISKDLCICREASSDDQPEIVEFQLAMAWESEKMKLDREVCTKGVATLFRNSHFGQYFVAEKENRAVGCLLIVPEWSDWRNGVVWWIHSVYVVPEERKGGIFRTLYQYVKDRGEKQDHFLGLRLYVDKTNLKAQAVYRRLGMSNEHYDLYEWMRDSE